jgi:hypothetical protein
MSEYTLIDCETDLIYGPYDSVAQAIDAAYNNDLKKWEILDEEKKLIVDWAN